MISVIDHIAPLLGISTYFILYGGHNANFVFFRVLDLFCQSGNLAADQTKSDRNFERF